MGILFGGQNKLMKKTSVHQSKNIKLNMSRRIRRTPFTDKVEKLGVSDFTVVNHMLLPKGFRKTVEQDYWHLSKHVQLWDVSCQRQVQISGKDAFKLIQKLKRLTNELYLVILYGFDGTGESKIAPSS